MSSALGAESAEHHHEEVLDDSVAVAEKPNLAAQVVKRLEMEDALFELGKKQVEPLRMFVQNAD